MIHSDKALIRASQIAYYTINKSVIDEVSNMSQNNVNFAYTLNELYESSTIFQESIQEKLGIASGLGEAAKYCSKETVISMIEDKAKYDEVDEKKVLQTITKVNEIFDIIEDIENGEIGSWKLVAYVYNDNMGDNGVAGKIVNGEWIVDATFSTGGNGMCTYVFETSEDSAIVAFRGSQPLNCLDDVTSLDFVSDWLAADVGLALENDETVQQKSTEQYIKDYVNVLGYAHYAFAGHSLGGNLALHAAA